MRLAVLASGSGTNFQALVDSQLLKDVGVEIVCLFCNVPGASVIARAEKAKIPTEVLSHKEFDGREAFDRAALARLAPHKPDLLALAGYMRMVSPEFLKAYPDRVLNIHPALLPAFPGTRAIEEAYQYGAKVTGVTIHLVDEGMDTGPIILQQPLEIHDGEPLELVEKRIHQLEHRLYPQAVALIAKGRLRREGRKVHIV